MRPRVLILGGTTEASTLAALLAGETRVDALLSLAGATRAPAAAPVARRIGGFGGAHGLAQFLGRERIALVVDATHPFARRITANAAAACATAGVPLLRILRPAWDERGTISAADMEEAASLLGRAPRRVLLTIGRLDLAPFGPPHRYWVRSVEAPDPALLPAGAATIVARGPFTLAGETALLDELGCDTLVTKNSGGAAVAAKLDAARALGLRIVMVRRPPEPACLHAVPAFLDAATDAHQAFASLMSHLAA